MDFPTGNIRDVNDLIYYMGQLVNYIGELEERVKAVEKILEEN